MKDAFGGQIAPPALPYANGIGKAHPAYLPKADSRCSKNKAGAWHSGEIILANKSLYPLY